MERAAQILVVDDEAPIRATLSALLRRAGYTVTTAENGEAAIALLAERHFDLLLCDLKMPGVDGMAVVRAAQAADPEIVCIVLTGHGSLESAIEGLRRDIFDYLLKTSDPQDVLARVAEGLQHRAQRERRKSMLQTLVSAAAELGERTPGTNVATPNPAVPTNTTHQPPLAVGALAIDPLRQEVQIGDRTITLTPTELRVLVCLAQHAGRAQTYVQLVHCAQGFDSYPAEAAELIKPHIYHLRQKLESDPKEPRLLLTVRGTGYMLAADE
jgi:DNA-binding response OmpR family regulator